MSYMRNARLSVAEFLDELVWYGSKIPLLYAFKADNFQLYQLMGFLVSRSFISISMNPDRYDDVCETLNWLTPIREYFPSEGDRGLYLDPHKRSFSMTLTVDAHEFPNYGAAYETLIPAFDHRLYKSGLSFHLNDAKEKVEKIKIHNTKFCLYLFRCGFRLGRFQDFDEIRKHIPKLYRPVFKKGHEVFHLKCRMPVPE